MRGCMASVDEVTTRKVLAKQKQVEKNEERIRKSQEQKRKLDEIVELASSSSDEEEMETVLKSGMSATATGPLCTPSVAKRARINVISPDLASALDRCKISDRKAVFVAAAAASSLGKDLSDQNINRSSISRARIRHRLSFTCKVKGNFKEELAHVPLTIHWDGKL